MRRMLIAILAKTKLGDWIAEFGIEMRNKQMFPILRKIWGDDFNDAATKSRHD